ncbi:MAG: hypothetical protein US60_C0043G0005 [Microgenomates group bacterium GW2011_GWC1_37_8]|uniref:DNA ligase (ATP) n=1 Tax=Candidatus Woesebacteria bacterium GW2011_GWB1_38_8 TaxID=1618570 RepID=A0A0G0L1W7_9BACT|nr:MAG: hypothetical protein US60_C0043G0005 [Microgenomates group bacterium GW2011_GWC1_37_8]KKQ84987.1 MAG: putative DNA ligase [Candidatus Woesebacteria bacterium GW2011_GWB1_38_8]
MKFQKLSKYLEKLEKTPSRLEITRILAEVYKQAEVEETDKITYLLLGSLAPNYKVIVFNLAERMMLEVLAKAYGIEKDKVREVYKKEGDLGNTASVLAQSTKNKAHTKVLSVIGVYERLLDMAKDEGEGSQERKINEMAKILSELDPLSARYVARIPIGRLRLGFSDKTILDSLSWMEVGDKSKKALLEKAYQVVPDVGLLAKKVKEVGIEKASKNIKPVVGIPVLPMLPQRIKSPDEMIQKMGKVFVEPKFDGLRVLIHFRRDKNRDREEGWINGVKAFTRNLNNVVEMFSELKDVGKHVKADELILDTEAIGMDPEIKKMVNFQTTMQRRRKFDIEAKALSIPLRFQVFDIIFKDGESLMDKPYYERREILKRTIADDKLLIVDDAIVTEDPEIINREYREKIKAGLEGVIVKKYDTAYIPGRTGWRWVKMKQEESATGKLADTVDCIVMGYTAGRGKRVSFGLGQFLVGVRDNDQIKTVTKVGTGLTDEQFRELKKRLSGLEVKVKPKNYEVHKLLEPDFWVNPEVVVEIAADEITKSPTHSAGLALRFPRLVKFRDDKDPDRATTVAEVKKLYEMQKI